ncbi:MAG: hypothetical protein MUF48_03215 [Pirellulaceae bacterium]|jgi:hypothetical protein|nr:hypothetical protein [Pirellulaceae bacterium]
MNRWLYLLSCLCLTVALSGCAMCDNAWDDAYNAYGGAVERQDRFDGRVGSVLSDPQMQVIAPGGRSDEPTAADLYPRGE